MACSRPAGRRDRALRDRRRQCLQLHAPCGVYLAVVEPHVGRLQVVPLQGVHLDDGRKPPGHCGRRGGGQEAGCSTRGGRRRRRRCRRTDPCSCTLRSDGPKSRPSPAWASCSVFCVGAQRGDAKFWGCMSTVQLLLVVLMQAALGAQHSAASSSRRAPLRTPIPAGRALAQPGP